MTRPLVFVLLLLISTSFKPTFSCGLRLSWSGRGNTYCKDRSCTDYFRWQPCGYWNPAECTCSIDIGKCPDGYTMSSDGIACYILRNGQENYLDAQNICLEKGDLGLARIRSDAQWAAAYSLMTAANGGSRHAYFGGNDIVSEGNFYYMDGTPMEYTRWRYRRGDQHQPSVSSADEQDCLKLVDTSGYWDDAPCDRNSGAGEYDFICERKPTCGSIGSITFGIGKK